MARVTITIDSPYGGAETYTRSSGPFDLGTSRIVPLLLECIALALGAHQPDIHRHADQARQVFTYLRPLFDAVAGDTVQEPAGEPAGDGPPS